MVYPRLSTVNCNGVVIPALKSKVHGANMVPIWGRQDPGGPHVSPMNFAIWVVASCDDVTVTLIYNEIQSPRGQHSILVFQWRLTSENVNA